jgi:polyisoprenoid-binding protein YceI
VPAADGEPAAADDGDPAAADDGDPAPADDGADPPADGAASHKAQLTPANTKIQFVGVHTDPAKPDRTGTFGQFSGTATVEGGKLTAVSVAIQTESLSTDIEKLTNHLKSPDFFAVKVFPEATFKSTKIEPAGDGKVNITGDLTLLDTTKSITLPATVTTDDRLKLNAEFTIDRTEFGMDYGQDGVKKEVAMTVTVGK